MSFATSDQAPVTSVVLASRTDPLCTQAVAVATTLAPTQDCRDFTLAWIGAGSAPRRARARIVATATAWVHRVSLQIANTTKANPK